MIKILLVESELLFREGLQSLIAQMDDMEVIGKVSGGEDAIVEMEELIPDIVLMGIHLPKLEEIQATAKIKELYPDVKVVFLSSEANEEMLLRGINVGADGFLVKSIHKENLHQALYNAYMGETVLAGDASKILVQRIRELMLDKQVLLTRRLQNRGIQLTKRELEIAELLMEGKSNKQICNKTGLYEGTVKNYVSEIYSKLGIRHRQQVTIFLKDLMKY